MPKIHNLTSFRARPAAGRAPMVTKELGRLAGSEKLYVNIDCIVPGAKSVKYHSHSKQEEFFLILRGTGKLRLQGRVLTVKAGDFFAKPGGRGLYHQFWNDGRGVLEILDCGTNERGDVCHYPDEGVRLIRDKRLAMRGARKLPDWSSDPNEKRPVITRRRRRERRAGR